MENNENRYSVSLGMYKFTVFERNDSASLKPPGNPRIVSTQELCASSEGDAIYKFREQHGIISTDKEFTVTLVKKGADLLAAEAKTRAATNAGIRARLAAKAKAANLELGPSGN